MFAAGKKILKVRTYADMRSLDPAFSQGIVDEEIQSSIYSKLIQYLSQVVNGAIDSTRRSRSSR